MGKLDGKIALITGGAGGIGRATAERFLAEGARVMLTDRAGMELEYVAAALGENAAWIEGDVSAEADVAAMVAACEARFGGLDILFANAGTEGRVGPLTALAVEDFDRVLAVNVRGAWLGIKHAAPLIAQRGGGSIVVTSSVAGVIGSPGLIAYIASKHAVMGVVKTAAMELAPLKIRVNSVNPGPVENRMMRSIEEQAAPGAGAAVKEGFLGKIPLHRYATNEEIAAMALFLASDESSYCTGAAFLVDGGFVAG